MVFSLLDYGVMDDQEQPLSPSLESFIEYLTRQPSELDEEGELEENEYDASNNWHDCRSPAMFSVDSGINDDCTNFPPEDFADAIKVKA